MTHNYPAVSSPQAQETRDDIIDRLRHYLEQREVETTKWRDQAMQLLEALNRMRVERDTAVAEQHRLFRGMARAGRELDAANARIAELERLLGETQAEVMTGAREPLAAYAHEAWAGWMRYLFKQGTTQADGSFVIWPSYVARWVRQMSTAYDELPEDEKKSDRNEADEMLAIIAALGAAENGIGTQKMV